MNIRVSELRKITEKLYSHLEDIGLDSVEITEDYYWNIPEDEKYSMENDPQNLDIGQLTDDWEFLRKVLEENRDPISYELVWLGKILQAIGEKLVS